MNTYCIAVIAGQEEIISGIWRKELDAPMGWRIVSLDGRRVSLISRHRRQNAMSDRLTIFIHL